MQYFTSILLTFSLLFFSCKKSNEEVVVNDGFTGKWQLVTYGIGIGGGGTMQNPDPAKPEIIEFKADSTFTANANCEYLKIYKSYKLVISDRINFSPATPFFSEWGFRFADNKLQLYKPGCREACIFEYKPVK